MYPSSAIADDGRILINPDGTVLVDCVCVYMTMDEGEEVSGTISRWFAKDEDWQEEMAGPYRMFANMYKKGTKIPKDDKLFWFDEYADGVEQEPELPSAN